MQIKAILLTISLSLCCFSSFAKCQSESCYQEKWCNKVGGQAEVILSDKTRCDCLTEEYAIEIDYARKWYQSIGQTLHYGLMTGKRPGIVLIIEEASDHKYLNRLQGVIKEYGLNIKIWKILP
jgi:hypothetical protein